MSKVAIFSLWSVCLLLLGGCSPTLEVGYKPPIPLPVRVSINQHGEMAVTIDSSYSTPFGTFDITAGQSLNRIEQSVNYPALIIRVDGEVRVYQLDPNTQFNVLFEGDDRLYTKVNLVQRGENIILELESVSTVAIPLQPEAKQGGTGTAADPSPPTAVPANTCPGAFPTRLAIGARAQVVAHPNLMVREEPNTRSDTVYGTSLSKGREVTVLNGPECDGGMLWWFIETGTITLTNGKRHNIMGWVAEESGNEWMLEPVR
jgi:hypothetical protein